MLDVSAMMRYVLPSKSMFIFACLVKIYVFVSSLSDICPFSEIIIFYIGPCSVLVLLVYKFYIYLESVY